MNLKTEQYGPSGCEGVMLGFRNRPGDSDTAEEMGVTPSTPIGGCVIAEKAVFRKGVVPNGQFVRLMMTF